MGRSFVASLPPTGPWSYRECWRCPGYNPPMDDPVGASALRAAAYDPPHRPTHAGGVMGAVMQGFIMGVAVMVMLAFIAYKAGVLDFDLSSLVAAP